MRENTEKNNSKYGHFPRSVLVVHYEAAACEKRERERERERERKKESRNSLVGEC